MNTPLVKPCPLCFTEHKGECNRNAPIIAVIGSHERSIVDGAVYELKAKPPMVKKDDEGWSEL
jgi:hypothetical protein